MARKKLSALAAPFQGRWRIAEMDLWDNDALDLVEPAFLEIKGQEGEMRFIAVTAWLDIRYDARAGGPPAPSSPGRASTRATNARAAAGSRSEPPDASSATSTSTWATIQASSARLFFSGRRATLSARVPATKCSAASGGRSSGAGEGEGSRRCTPAAATVDLASSQASRATARAVRSATRA